MASARQRWPAPVSVSSCPPPCLQAVTGKSRSRLVDCVDTDACNSHAGGPARVPRLGLLSCFRGVARIVENASRPRTSDSRGSAMGPRAGRYQLRHPAGGVVRGAEPDPGRSDSGGQRAAPPCVARRASDRSCAPGTLVRCAPPTGRGQHVATLGFSLRRLPGVPPPPPDPRPACRAGVPALRGCVLRGVGRSLLSGGRPDSGSGEPGSNPGGAIHRLQPTIRIVV